MQFQFSPHIALEVTEFEAAIRFYTQVMGMQLVADSQTEVELRSGLITFYVERGSKRAVFFEFSTDDLAAAKAALAEAGCRFEPAKTPEGADSTYVRDPYGMVFHLWESPDPPRASG